MNVQRGWDLTGADVPEEERRGRLVLVGECPAPGWEGRPEHIMTGTAFSGVPGKPGRLARVAGLNFRQYFGIFDRVNVYDKKALAWSKHHQVRAVSQAGRILDEVAEGRELILLGRRVASAFGLPRRDIFLTSFSVGDAIVHSFPHPSGRNHWWNHERNRRGATRFLRKIIERAREISRS